MSASAPTLAGVGFGWGVVEMYQTGRFGDPALLEEAIVANPSGVFAVVDGGESGSGEEEWLLRGQPVTPGRFAAWTVADVLARVPAGSDPRQVVEAASSVLERSMRAQRPALEPTQRPSCSATVFDPALGLIYWVGSGWHAVVTDSGWVQARRDRTLFDDIVVDARLAILEGAQAAGSPWQPDDADDPSDLVVAALLRQRRALVNTTGRFGVGGINGTPVPPGHLLTRHLEDGDREVVLASDGYPAINVGEDFACASAEAHLARLLAEDPGCTGPLAGPQGVRPGQVSFADRSWLRLRAG